MSTAIMIRIEENTKRLENEIEIIDNIDGQENILMGDGRRNGGHIRDWRFSKYKAQEICDSLAGDCRPLYGLNC